MINIISNEIFKPETLVTGQTKVFRNLLKGLEMIGCPYALNKKHDYCDRLWIYNDQKAVQYLKNIDTEKIKTIIGPDISMLNLIKNKKADVGYLKNCLALQPSQWTNDFLMSHGFDLCALDYWPSGIDMEVFSPTGENKEYVLIYFKQRFRFELSLAISALKKRNIKYVLVEYGKYSEGDYQSLLNKARYVIWIGRQESQGIAMGEALAKNVPMLVWEVSCFGHWQPPNKKETDIYSDEELAFVGARSATYFDDSCGLVRRDFPEFETGIDAMEIGFANFNPREYVNRNLSLEGQARAFVALFDKYWPESGHFREIGNHGSWKSERWTKLMANIYYKIR